MTFDAAITFLPHEVTHLTAAVADVVDARRRAAVAEVDEARALERAVAAGERIIAALPRHRSEDDAMAMRAITADLATAAGVSERTMQRRMTDAASLVRRFADTVEAWSAGRITRQHAIVIAEHGTDLPDDLRAEYEGAVLARADELTPGRLAAYARRLAEDYRPVPLAERHAAARRTRGIAVIDLDDGMSQLTALLPTVLAHAIHDRLTRQAHALKDARGMGDLAEVTASDERGLDEVRADLLCDLLLAATPSCGTPTGLGAITAVVQVTVPALALIDGEGWAELAGRAPIDIELARGLAGHATGWDRVLTHPVDGEVLAVDRYRPGDALKRLLRARDQHCRFPGCRRAAPRCDLDHTVAAVDGGETSPTNLAHLCRRHHTMKHATPWRVRQHPGGVLEWTSPTGAVIPDRPPAAVRFEPAPF